MNPLSRFARPSRKAIRAAAMIVAATTMLELAALATWWAYSAWRLGRIELTNDGPPLTVQVLGASTDAAIGEPVELVERSTLALPEGDYRIRVTGAGRIGRTYRLAVNRGEMIVHSVSLDGCRLLGEAPPHRCRTNCLPRRTRSPSFPARWRSS